MGISLIVVMGITYLALESGDVLIAETNSPALDEVRQTHIWFVQRGANVYLEAGHPENPWVQDLEAGSNLILMSEGLDGEYDYVLHREGRHQEIRELMREKYGWRDWWVSLLFDTTQSYLIEVSANQPKQ